MKYFYDTEFIEDGKTIDLISIGIVADDGREFYAVNEEIESPVLYPRIRNHEWLMENVIPHLPLEPGSIGRPAGARLGCFNLDLNDNRVMPPRMIRNAVRTFILSCSDEPELWADYGAYDHVALCQLFGSMIDLPEGMPMFTHDIQQYWREHGCPALPAQAGDAHNALDDARYARDCYEAIRGASF